ncbi:hypothetical protein M378DRAFT_79902 [Amanita muscaria Koide BX008]|uniref:BCAS3 WD40 domain-containing protein n=1 Tax=Amanita muscaria (strain Koide BX008) TaxID=946122 RepID=A0A0C2X3K6_AMAMK|nr:hypothetical protein M378DRAFT_79902 [Amanita muscaria Koide BX008]
MSFFSFQYIVDKTADIHNLIHREQTTLESFSRTLRTYVPSSIHIPVPRSAPSPPLVSRPVSFGSFSASPLSQPIENAFRGGHHPYDDQERVTRIPAQHREQGSTASGLARALQQRDRSLGAPAQSHEGMSYPGSDVTHLDPILWARWDSINDRHACLTHPTRCFYRRLLILVYKSGFQFWDCTNLDSVTEVLNLNTMSPEWLEGGEIVHVAVLPSPDSQIVKRFGDPYAESRPLLGVLMNLDNATDFSTLFIYSLSRQILIKQVPLSSLSGTFQASAYSLVFSITDPPTLHIYSPSTFKEIYTINSNSLVPFSHSPVSYSNFASKLFTTGSSNNNKENNDAVFLGNNTTEDPGSPSPKPIFALSHRLLAYASPSPLTAAQQAQLPPSGGSGNSSGASPSTSPFGIGGLNMQMTQADLGNTALKVGGSLLSGMKTLGGMALSAAKSHISGSAPHHHHADLSSAAPPGRQQPHQHHKFVSISAPSGADANLESGTNRRERRHSTTSSTGSQDGAGRSYDGSEQRHTSPILPNTPMGFEQGSFVTVIDLGPLVLAGSSSSGGGSAAAPVTVAEFFTSKSQAVAGLHFSSDGCNIVVVPMNGQVVQVYQLRPTPGVLRLVGNGKVMDVTTRMYRLRRGRSQAVVNDAAWASDGRWAAIGTLRPTVHVFAINPYGGKPDLKSHMEGKVLNSNELQLSFEELSPLVRIRALKSATSEQSKTGLSFTFIDSSEACLPTSLLPTNPGPGHVVGSAEVGSSPHHRPRPTNYQDMLVFDHNDGILSLRRITTEVRAKDQGLSVSTSMSMSAAALSATSISLPGLGGAGKLSSSTSPSSAGFSVSSSATSGKQVPSVDIHVTHELVGKAAVVATWNLQRRKVWEEVRQSIGVGVQTRGQARPSPKATRSSSSYLAHAELSTFSRSSQIVPRSIYLSHQFSFYSLGEDYHALIRRSQLDISGQKIEVRKEVVVSAFSSAHGASEAFVEGFLSSSSRDTRRHSGSFDEPLANALSGGLEYNTSMVPPTLPMYPNGGTAGSRSRPSFRNPIPIRTIGMSDSLSRLRREINKVRSPHLLPRTEGAGGSSSPGLVPLEFDEEDEDFLSRGNEDLEDLNRDLESTIVPVPDPPQAIVRDDDASDVSSGWDLQDRQAVEDEERFHDLVVPGLMDEEAGVDIANVGGGSETVRVKGKAKRR